MEEEEEKVKREAVSSSNIASIGYEEKSETLEIEFHSGGVYQYFDVPRNVYNGLMSTGSHGRFFTSNIKGIYRYRKI